MSMNPFCSNSSRSHAIRLLSSAMLVPSISRCLVPPLPIFPFPPFSSSFILQTPLRLRRRCSLRRLIPLLRRLVRLRRRAPASWSLQHVPSARMLRLYVGSVTAARRKGFVSYDPGFLVYVRTCIACVGCGGGRGEGEGEAQKRKNEDSPQILHEIADGTRDLLVFVERERYHGLRVITLSISLFLFSPLLFIPDSLSLERERGK